MIGLARAVGRYGLRDGWMIWRTARAIDARASLRMWLLRNQPTVRIHHGARPTLPAYRRKRS